MKKIRWWTLTAMVTLILTSCSGALQETPTPTHTVAPTPIVTLAPAEYEKLLSPEDMRFDLDKLFDEIALHHPNPYMHRSKEDVEQDRQELNRELEQPMNIVDFYRRVTPLIASLGDDHTAVFLPDKVLDEIYTRESFLPLEVEFRHDHFFVIASYAADISTVPLGSVLLTVNGIKLNEEKMGLIPSAGGPFILKLWLLTGSVPAYEVSLVPPGETTPIEMTIPGLTVVEIAQKMTNEEPTESATYKTLPNETIGILTVNRFISVDQPLKQAFAQIQQDGIQDLIIDVRANHGGYYESLQLLMNYLTDQPYQRCAKCAYERPWETQNRFHGNLYLLIGPETMSAAVTFSTILQDHGMATLIGEETIEPASYCANIIVGGEPLPRTKLRYICSQSCFIRPSGVVNGRGVIPDFIVETSIEDEITGNDPVLAYTLNMIRKNDPIH